MELQQVLKDPKSYESIKWAKVEVEPKYYLDFVREFPDYKGKLYKFLFVNSYRAKNSFGGLGVYEAMFLIDEENNCTIVEKKVLPIYLERQLKEAGIL